MSFQFSDAGRNAALDAIFTTIGASAILRIRTGVPPANIAAASTGTVLATMNLPSTYMAAASGGSKSKTGTWEDLSADAAGRAGYFEIARSNGTTREIQGICAGPWKASTAYAVGDTITNDSGKVYRCATAGTSASSGGPTGTGSGITDGTAVWNYVQAAADMSLDNGDLTLGQAVTVNTFTVTAGGA